MDRQPERGAACGYPGPDPVRIRHLPHAVTIFECRPPWKPEFGPEWTRLIVAQLRFTVVGNLWSLYWRDSSEAYHPYFEFDAYPDVSDLLAEIDRDPTAIFWG